MDDLSRLKVLYVPHWVMWKTEWTPRVDAFVAAGGTLILSAMTGTRDADNHIHRTLAPAAGLSELAGVKVIEFGRLTGPGADGLFNWRDNKINGGHVRGRMPPASSAARNYSFTFGNQEFTAAHLYEMLELAPGTEPLGQWSNCFLVGTPVVTRRTHGKGQVVYLGTYLTPELAAQLAISVLEPAGAIPLVADLPEGVEVSIRQSDHHALVFVLNTTASPVTIQNAPKGTDLLSDSPVTGTLVLGPFGCAIIKQRPGG